MSTSGRSPQRKSRQDGGIFREASRLASRRKIRAHGRGRQRLGGCWLQWWGSRRRQWSWCARSQRGGRRWDGDRLHRNRRATAGGASGKFSPADDRLSGHTPRRHHRQIDDPLVADLPGPEVLGDKVERKDLVPGNREWLPDCQRLKAVLHQPDLAGAVIDKVGRDRCGPDLIVIDIHQRAGRVAADRHPALNAPGSSSDRQHPCDRHQTHTEPMTAGFLPGNGIAGSNGLREHWTPDHHVGDTTGRQALTARATRGPGGHGRK
jgi:hypothetical protein